MWGRFEHSLDDKGRVIVPQKFREKLGEEFVLTIGPDHHIRVYPMLVWEAMEEQLVSADVLDELDPDLQFLQRMFGNCEFVSYDQQNRLSLPRHLREWASLRESEPAIIIGSGTRLEIWSRGNWDKFSDFTGEKSADAAARRRSKLPPNVEEVKPPTEPREHNGQNGQNGQSGQDEPHDDSNGLR
jgi:MraZ protein